MDLRGPWQLLSFLVSTNIAAMLSKIPFLPLWISNFFRSRWRSRDNNNTAVLHHNNRLYALVESGAPHEVSPKDLSTLHRETFGGKLTHPFTAHPKVCPTTGECVFFGYSSESPYCTVSSILRDGTKAPSVEVPLSSPVMMHDFAITAKHAVILDLPLAFTPKAILSGRNIFSWDHQHPSRIGVISRLAIHDRSITVDDASRRFDDHNVKKGLRRVPVQWFKMMNPSFIFHVAASYEEERFNTNSESAELWVVVFAIAYAAGFSLDVLGGLYSGNDHEHNTQLMGIMTRYECCLATGELRETAATGNILCEFPVIHPSFVGMPVDFCYISANHHDDTCIDFANPIRFCRLIKLRLPVMEVDSIFEFPVGTHIGEFSFVPDSTSQSSKSDEGHLVGYVTEQVTTHDSFNGVTIRILRSYSAIIDARTMKLIAKINLPHVVPLGFHGTFLAHHT